MAMSINEIWIWIVVGLLPYRVKWQSLTNGVCTLEMRALFWSLAVRLRRSGRHDWKLSVPLIERLRDAVWAAVMRLHDNQPPEA
jgi:hypothetical protein